LPSFAAAARRAPRKDSTMVQKKKKAAAPAKLRKPPKRDAGKKLGKKADMTEFRAQLDSLGLKIVEVNADGNCFFSIQGNG